MTRNKYCNVCGTDFRRRRSKKEKPEPSMKKKFLSSKRKTIISLLSVFIIIGIALPITLIQISQRPHYEGKLKIQDVNIVPFDQSIEQLEVVFGVEYGIVFVKDIHLYSLARDKHYGSYSITFELEQYELQVESFDLSKSDPLFTDGFSLKIIHKYKVQWITYLF